MSILAVAMALKTALGRGRGAGGLVVEKGLAKKTVAILVKIKSLSCSSLETLRGRQKGDNSGKGRAEMGTNSEDVWGPGLRYRGAWGSPDELLR